MIWKELIRMALENKQNTEANTLCLAQILEEDGKDVVEYIPNIEIVKSKVSMKYSAMNGFDVNSELKEVGQAETEYLLEHEPCEFWNEHFIVSIEFFSKLESTIKDSSGDNKTFTTTQRSVIARKLGYREKHVIKYKGASRRLYLKKVMTNSEIREVMKDLSQDVDDL